MKKIEYANMAEREQTYWWHVGRLRVIETYLSRAQDKMDGSTRLLNVGCGTGGTVDLLEGFGEVDNVDISDDAIGFMKLSGHRRVTKVTGVKLPFKANTYDAVCAFDVLEHIDDQTAALKEWKRVLKNNGSIILTVPAYPWLWTDHDASLHHKRRYTIKSLIHAAEAAGLLPQKISYAIVFSLPLVIGFRFLNKVLGRKTDSETSYVNVPNWVNTAFYKFLYVEARLHKYITFPVGTSIVAIFRKPDNE